MALSIPWRTGANLREFAYYGTPALQWAPASLQRSQLDGLRDIGVELVRIFAHHHSLVGQSIDRVRAALDLFNEYGMQVIVCLDDSLSHSGYCVPGDENYHTEVHGHFHKKYFHEKRYQVNYMPRLKAMVSALKDHPAVLMWELGNEHVIHPQPAQPRDGDAFLNYAREASTAIKEIAPHHLVTTGLVNSRHVGFRENDEEFATKLYGMDTIDAISLHLYQHEGGGTDWERHRCFTDINVAKKLGKPWFMGEFGARHTIGNRRDYYASEMQTWRDQGAFSAMAWAFDTSSNDVGVSDQLALARIFGDFNDLCNVMKHHAANAGRFTPPVDNVTPQTSDPGTTPSDDPGTTTPPTTDDPVDPPTTPDDPRRAYAVIAVKLSVRSEPGLDRLTKQGEFLRGEVIVADPATAQEAAGYIWLKHINGWSAWKKVDGSDIYMQPIEGGEPITSMKTKNTDKYQVTTTGGVNVRNNPSLSGVKRGAVPTGETIEADPASEKEVEGYIWVEHFGGWSAVRNSSGSVIFLTNQD